MKVLYLTGLAHCGSTFLARVLNQHPEIFAAGELTNLYEVFEQRKRGCSCTNTTYDDCQFWSETKEMLDQKNFNYKQASRLSHDRKKVWLHALLSFYGLKDISPFQTLNEQLFDVLQHQTNTRIILDTSKTIWRLLPLSRTFQDDLKILHLIKAPGNQMHSRLKRDYNFYHSAIMKYLRKNGLLNVLFGSKPNYRRIKFEEFVEEPSEVIQSVQDWIGLEPQDPFSTELQSFHHLRGNSQAYGNLESLRPDPAKLQHGRDFSFLQQRVLNILRPIYNSTPSITRN